MKDSNGMEHSSENGRFVSKDSGKNSTEAKKANAERIYNTHDEERVTPKNQNTNKSGSKTDTEEILRKLLAKSGWTVTDKVDEDGNRVVISK